MRPPWTRWRATHPHSVTRLPTSSADNSPQKPVRATHWRGVGGLGLGMRVSEAEAEAEIEAEKMEVCLGRGLEREGFRRRMVWEWERRGRGLERRGMRGKVLRRRDMAFVVCALSGLGGV